MSHPIVSEKIPPTFWSEVVPDAIKVGIENYIIYGKQQQMIDKGAYISDLIGSLIAFSFSPVENNQFWKSCEQFFSENLAEVPNRAIENLIFVFL
jgi:hypothetical protein